MRLSRRGHLAKLRSLAEWWGPSSDLQGNTGTHWALMFRWLPMSDTEGDQHAIPLPGADGFGVLYVRALPGVGYAASPSHCGDRNGSLDASGRLLLRAGNGPEGGRWAGEGAQFLPQANCWEEMELLATWRHCTATTETERSVWWPHTTLWPRKWGEKVGIHPTPLADEYARGSPWCRRSGWSPRRS